MQPSTLAQPFDCCLVGHPNGAVHNAQREGGHVIRIGTEADIPWIVDRCRITHAYSNLGEFCPEKVAEQARETTNLISGDSVLCGAEMEMAMTSKPTVNLVHMWHTNGAAWDLLEAHEQISPLPSVVTVVFGHPRAAALFRALSAKGYEPMEIHMVKHG